MELARVYAILSLSNYTLIHAVGDIEKMADLIPSLGGEHFCFTDISVDAAARMLRLSQPLGRDDELLSRPAHDPMVSGLADLHTRSLRNSDR
jgi:hypothetical protein